MIEYLRGVLLRRDGQHVVIDAGGVGYGLDVPLTTLARLGPQGGEAELHVYFHYNDQAMRLFGFATIEERDVFEVFLGTTGIGPKTALAILSAIEIGDFAQAILRNDLKILTNIPGIGKKTAERLVVELREKMATFADAGSRAGSALAGAVGTVAMTSPAAAEALAALMTLGCSRPVAERAIEKALVAVGTEALAEQLLREGLKHRH